MAILHTRIIPEISNIAALQSRTHLYDFGMKTVKQNARQDRIETAAYAVLEECGYRSTSLLAIAKRASVSNETLYRHYGNKQGLFRSLIQSNAQAAKDLLEAAKAGQSDPLKTLEALGPVLLALVTSQRAIILNRAAVGDVTDTATLGKELAQFGRNTIAPLVVDILQLACAAGQLRCYNLDEVAETYFALLIGDLQIRRAIGTIEELQPFEIQERARHQLGLFLRLYQSNKLP